MDSLGFVVVTTYILIYHVLLFGSASSSAPLPCHPACHDHVPPSCSSLWVHLILTDPNNPKPALLSLFCIYFTVFLPQSHSGGDSVVHLGKTSFVQKGRSMFPKVLLQWCAAISSCAAEIGKLLTRLHHVRLSALSASYLCCKVMGS